jgi:hypothetical protein
VQWRTLSTLEDSDKTDFTMSSAVPIAGQAIIPPGAANPGHGQQQQNNNMQAQPAMNVPAAQQAPLHLPLNAPQGHREGVQRKARGGLCVQRKRRRGGLWALGRGLLADDAERERIPLGYAMAYGKACPSVISCIRLVGLHWDSDNGTYFLFFFRKANAATRRMQSCDSLGAGGALNELGHRGSTGALSGLDALAPPTSAAPAGGAGAVPGYGYASGRLDRITPPPPGMCCRSSFVRFCRLAQPPSMLQY